MKRLILSAAVLSCLIPATAMAASTGSLKLDSFYPWSKPYTPPVSSPFTVAKHVYYVATVSGTFSYYAASRYTKPENPWPIVCGTAGTSTQYKGSLGGNGPVGLDAAFIFSRPWSSRNCRKHHLPIRWPNLQLNDGAGWAHPIMLGPWLTAPNSKHTYSYAVSGHGAQIQFRLDDVYTRDNYGLLKIALRPALASDCSSYQAFGFASAAKCATTLPARS